jgi:hypothetical protein
MSDVNIFEQATRLDLTFQLPVGELNIQSLWKLKPVKRNGKLVDDLADYEIELKEQLSKFSQVRRRGSVAKTNEQELLELRLAIVSHILDVKDAEAQAAKEEAAKKIHNEKIRGIMAKKQDDKYEGLSIEELEGLLIK